MKRVYLIDLENVHMGGVKGVGTLSAADDVYLFHADNEHAIAAFISDMRYGTKCVKVVKSGQNALDFQMSSFLGYAIHEAQREGLIDETMFFIVSKDTGFDSVVKFWTEAEFADRLHISPKIERVMDIQTSFIPLSIRRRQIVSEIMKTAKSFDDFHMAVIRKFGSTTGSEMYKQYKAEFKTLKGL